MALDDHVETFIIYMTFLLTIVIYLVRQAQIALLITKKMQILFKYSDFLDVFSKKKALILAKTTNLNQYAIKFQEN